MLNISDYIRQAEATPDIAGAKWNTYIQQFAGRTVVISSQVLRWKTALSKTSYPAIFVFPKQ